MSVKLIFSLLLYFPLAALAQETKPTAEQEASYTKVVTERAEKIVKTLGLRDEKKAIVVRDIIAQQYKDLNTIHNTRNELVKKLKTTASDKEVVQAAVTKIEDDATTSLNSLHKRYLSALSAELTPQQIEQVKDGMTYGVVKITYKGYQDMIPNLTTEQKKKIYDWLVEARELAMDAESSEKKHATFGKFKGRINNYLSAAGYDLRKEGNDWQKRIKATEASKNN